MDFSTLNPLGSIHFCSFQKDSDLSHILEEAMAILSLPSAIEGFHPKRKSEFILSRYCAHLALKQLSGDESLGLDIGIGENREPLWPQGIVGSITHNQDYVICAVASQNDYQSLGIDIESIDRLSTKLDEKIQTELDIRESPFLSSQQIRTLIFSAKESLYKSLYPLVGEYFGFHHAAVKEISTNSFTIELVKDFSKKSAFSKGCSFQGNFLCDGKNLFTLLTC